MPSGEQHINMPGLHIAIAKKMISAIIRKKLPIDLRNKDNRFDKEDENEFKSQAQSTQENICG